MIRIIAAMDARNGIAKQGIQPWYLPTDLRYFSSNTKRYGATVVMGRTTFVSIGKLLAGRQKIILSRHAEKIDGAKIATDLNSLLEKYLHHKDIWVIGGADIFQQALELADELFLTKIEGDFDCDLFFPDYNQKFQEIYKGPRQTEKGLNFSFYRYKNINRILTP